MQAVEPPKLRALKINVILKVIVKGGRRRQLALSLGFTGAILDVGRHVVGLEQVGRVGHVSFLLGGLREQQKRSQCSEHWLSRWGSEGEDTLSIQFLILAQATHACVDPLFLLQPHAHQKGLILRNRK